MNTKEMNILTAHFDKYFGQNDCTVLHPIVDTGMHVDALLYKPTEKYPFWKLATMGASDYKMNAPKNSLGNRNEYIMAISPDENMTDMNVANWYFNKLLEIALYPAMNKTFVSYGHSMEWTLGDGEEMVGAYLEMPQMIEDAGILRCRLGLFKNVTCLLAVLINKNELDKLLKEGPERFSYYLFPEDEGSCHYLSEKTRSDKF